MFQRGVVPPSSGPDRESGGTTLHQNVGNGLPVNMACKISKDSSLHLNLCDNQTTHNKNTVLCDIIAGKTRNSDMLYTVTIVRLSLVLNLTSLPHLICNLHLPQ